MDWKLELVVVPVTDVERAKRFYSEQVGFAVDHDTRVDDRIHIVQLTPPGVEVSRVQHYEGADLVGGSGDRWNSFVFFRAPDGNGWAVQERPAD